MEHEADNNININSACLIPKAFNKDNKSMSSLSLGQTLLESIGEKIESSMAMGDKAYENEESGKRSAK